MFGDLSYTGKDIISIREEVMDYIRENDPNWTDYNESSLQMQYVDIVSGVVDMMCYYLDNQALETYLPTARQEKNIRTIMQMLNYDVPYIGPAQGYIHVQRGEQEEGTYLDDIIYIPKYTEIYAQGDSGIPHYLTVEDAYLRPKDIKIKIPIVQGTLRDFVIPISSVRDSYKLYLTTNVIPTDWVFIDDPTWEKVPDAFKEIGGGKKYSVHLDSKGKCFILFTCNWRSFLSDESDATMRITYIETSGKSGIVQEYMLDTFGAGPYDITIDEPCPFYLKVWNSEPTFGAFDKIDLNRQKANALNWLQTYDRLITLKDFETMVRKNPWVKDCYVADWRTNGKLVQYPHEARAWVVPIDGNIPILDEKFQELETDIQKKTVIMTSVHIHPAVYREMNWVLKLSVTGASSTEKERIRSGIETMLRSRYLLSEFCNDNEESLLKFNMEVRHSTLEAAVYNYSSAITNLQWYQLVPSEEDPLVKVEVPITEDFRLAENEFLDVKTLVVELVE